MFISEIKSMLIVLYTMAAVTGLLFGSFYTALADRILLYGYGPERKNKNKYKNIFFKESFCFSCKKKIPLLYLMPVIGYIAAGGKCKYCKNPIGKIRLAGEILPGILLPLLIYTTDNWPYSFFSILVAGHLYIAAATDYTHHMLDYENTAFIYVWSVLALFFLYHFNFDQISIHLYTALFTFIIFLALYLAGRGRKMGAGDAILAPALSLYLGVPESIFLFIIASSTSIIHIVLIEKDLKYPSPLGMHMAIGFLTVTAMKALMIAGSQLP